MNKRALHYFKEKEKYLQWLATAEPDQYYVVTKPPIMMKWTYFLPPESRQRFREILKLAKRRHYGAKVIADFDRWWNDPVPKGAAAVLAKYNAEIIV